MTYYTGEGIEEWQGRLLIGGLRPQQLITLSLTAPDEEPPEGTTYDADWMDNAYIGTTTAALEGEIGRIR